MSFSWKPLVNPPDPSSISGLSDDAGKILKAIMKPPTQDKNAFPLDCDKSKVYISTRESWNSTDGKKYVSGHELAVLDGSTGEMRSIDFANRNMLVSDNVDICRYHPVVRCKAETLFAGNANTRNETNKGGKSCNCLQQIVSDERISGFRQLKEFQLYVVDGTPLVEECLAGNDVSKVKSRRTYNRQRMKMLRQLKIYDYFVPAKKQKP